MSTFRVNKNVNYTVMSNHHLQDKRLSLKAKGLLSYMLSLPDDWDYSLKGLTTGCRDGIDSVRSAVHELEDGGYLCRSKVRDARGRIIDYNYEVFELPQKERIEKRPAPVPNSPSSENPMSGFPTLENPTQQNTNKQNTKRQSTNLSGQTDESADFDQMEAQVREEFRERLEIDTLAQRYDPDKLEELLDNIVEMYCCPRQTQYVGKQPQTTKAIRLRLDKLTSQHIEYIFDVMSNTTQPIKNIMAYLRTTILNAPTTVEHYYQAQGNWLTAQNRKKWPLFSTMAAKGVENKNAKEIYHENRNDCPHRNPLCTGRKLSTASAHPAADRQPRTSGKVRPDTSDLPQDPAVGAV